MVADFLWRHGEGQSSRFLTDHPLYHHQSYWCQYRYSAPAPLEPWLRDRERQREREGRGLREYCKRLSKNSVSCLSACVWERESHSERLSVCSTQSRLCTEGRSGMYDLPSWPVLTLYLLCSHTLTLTYTSKTLPASGANVQSTLGKHVSNI